MNANKKVILFYNHKSGLNRSGNQLSLIRQHLYENHFEFSIIDLPKPYEEIRDIVSQSINNGFDLFVAAGGDGTVSLVSDPLVGTGKPLGIIPLGTGNLIAKTLNIPLKLDKALELITSPNHDILQIDTLKVVNDRNYLSNVSVGVTPELMANTCQDDKQRMGFLAYFVSLVKQLLGLKLHRYYIEYDQHQASFLATEILITNGRSTGLQGLEWSEDVSVNDGELDIIVLRAVNIMDFLRLVFSIFTKKQKSNPRIRQLTFRDYCRIETRQTVRVQADGDVVRETPVEVYLVPKSMSIIINHSEQQ
jgi:YegS/Rv2252/BmrU family lipid kinase